MKRFFTTSFIILALIVGTAGAAPAVHAQFDSSTSLEDASSRNAPTAAENAQAASAGIDPAAEKTTTNDKLGPPTTPKATLNGIMAYIAQLFAWLLGVAVITLDYSVFYTVVTMGNYVKDLSAVGITWQIMRDIGNIVIIFGFLAIGISIILNTERMGYGKKMLPMLLVAAVFLNFSLFLSEAVIDTGNLFATQFYTQINGGQPAGAKISAGVFTGINNEGISNKIMSSLGLMTIYGDVKNNNNGGAEKLLDNYWTIGFMSIILFLVAAFVMFSLAFILIARFVILLFLIIIAPIGFAGLAVPQLKGTADKWWKTLFEQTITAPVLLLLLYIALRVITDVNFLTGLGAISWTGTLSNNIDSFARTLISFLIAMGLLLAVVIISKKMSAAGAAGASALAGKLTFGATAWGMRTSGGWLAKKGANVARKTWVGRVPLVGTGLTKGLDRIAGASFDVRGIKAGGGLKALGGIDAGEAQKGGYKADLKARTESRTKYASELKGRELNDQEKIDAAKLQAEIKNDTKDLQKLRARGADVATVKIAEDALKVKEKGLERIENVTDRGAQRKYASNLELGYLGLNDKSFFNKYVNFAANTEAAKKIRGEAKKSKTDKDWAENMKKALKEAAKEEEEEAVATPPPAAASTTPPPTAPTGGGTPPPAP
jgi:hypothetical protein